MLTAPRTTRLRSLAALAATAALALSTAGCGAAIKGEHDAQFHFLVEPQSSGGTFWGWTEITLGGDINSVGTTNLWAVSLAVEKPPEADLSFLSTLTGQAVVGETRTTVVQGNTFPPGQSNVYLNVVYHDDLHPLFKDSTTIRIEWTGNTNPAFTKWPQGGIWIQGDVVVNVQ
jgi:hypothetical protein